jgi:hypothetical protein
MCLPIRRAAPHFRQSRRLADAETQEMDGDRENSGATVEKQ